MKEEQNKKEDVRPADALGRLSERTRASRVSMIIVVLIGFFVIVFLIGMIVRGFSGGLNNAPSIPQVEL